MTKTQLETIDVLTLLPQRPPFVMIDRLIHFDEVVTTTQLEVRPDNLFMEADGLLNNCALVENIAQTCAARMGYINQYIYKERVRLGFIGSIKKLLQRHIVVLVIFVKHIRTCRSQDLCQVFVGRIRHWHIDKHRGIKHGGIGFYIIVECTIRI